MVRVVSVAHLGYGDYGGHFTDREVDGVDYSQTTLQVENKIQDPKPKPKPKPTKKLLGGRSTR